MNICIRFILCFTILFSIHIFSQEKENLFALSLEELLELKVITASKVEQSILESPASIYVITSAEIKDQNYHNLEEILHDLPGFDFNKGFGVNYSTIFMRGYRSDNSDRFILLYDGMLQNDIWKQTNWISRQYPITNIERIEIMYGPASALYGTNAFSGIVNVITKEADIKNQFDLSISLGSFGRKNFELSSRRMLSSSIGYNITFKYFSANRLHDWNFMKIGSPDSYSKDLRDFLNDPATGYSTPMVWMEDKMVPADLDNDLPAQNYGIHAKLYLGKLNFTALYWVKKELEGYWYNPFNRRGTLTEWFIGAQNYKLSHQLTINNKMSLNSDLIYRINGVLDSREVFYEYYFKYDPLDYNTFDIIDNDPSTFKLKLISDGTSGKVLFYNSSVFEISIEEKLIYDINKKLNLIFGTRLSYTDTQEDYNYSDFSNLINKSPRHYKQNSGSYLQLIYKPSSNINLTFGGRYEHQRDEQANGYEIFTPRLAAVIKANDNLRFRIQFAEAFQEADDWHKFATEPNRPAPSPNLRPEKLSAIEIGAIYNPNNSLVVNGALYFNKVNDLIATVDYGPDNKYVRFQNQGEMDIYGYELFLTYRYQSNLFFKLNISGAWNEIYENGNSREFGDIAPLKINLLATYKTEKFSLSPKLNYIGKKNTINHNVDASIYPVVNYVDSYLIAGFNFNYFGIDEDLTFNIKIDNIFHVEYFNPGTRSADGIKYNAKVLQPGFNLMAGLSYNFTE